MPINTTLEKTRKDLERTLADVDKTPLYAVVGVTDLAVEKIRVARAELSSRASRLDLKSVRDQAQVAVAHRVAAVQSDVASAPEHAKALPVKAQVALGEVMGTALTAYGDLAGRGKNLVTRVRRQQSTTDLTDQAKSTAARAKSTATTVKKQAATTKRSASAATTTATRSAAETGGTAKKSAGRAKSSAKATTTSAKKTATAAKKATSVTASKVGN
jgi:hypothetical protein